DTGPGIPEAIKSRLFEPFFTTKPVGQGTGLGLPMVQGIAKQHEGWIELASEPGQGACFDLYLPRAECEAEKETRLVHRALPPSPVPLESGVLSKTPHPLLRTVPHGPNSTAVMIVDDEAMIRDLGRVILERAGYSVLTAEDGAEAVDLFAKEHNRVD